MGVRSEGRRLIRRFAAASLIAFLAAGVGVALIAGRAVRSQEEAGATLHARTVGDGVIRPMLRPLDIREPVTGARYAALVGLLRERVFTDGRVVRVKVWRPDGTITFSDDPSLVGRHFPLEEDLRQAASGTVVSDVSELSEAENVSERRLASKLFETYVPLEFPQEGRVTGVIEVYQQYAYVQQEVDRLNRTVALAFGGGLAALYLVLMPLVLGAARRLRERNELLTQQAAELREAEAKYRALVEQLPAIVYAAEFDQAGKWLYVSPQIERILGYTPEEWIEDPTLFDMRLHPEDVERYRAAEAESHREGSQFGLEYRMLSKDGRAVWFRDDAVVIRDADGHPRFQQGVMLDVTESKSAEAALRSALAREQEAAERLRALDQMRNSFLQAVSHELRTPLTAVLGFALTLQRTELDLSAPDRQEMVDRLAANARKLERLLSDLLDMDRIARGVLEPKLAPIHVGEVARRVADESDVGGRALHVEAPELEVLADGAKVERILENLLVNAARHTPDGTTIWLRVEAVPDGIVLTIEDDGPGIPDSLKSAIFEPFRQGATVNTHHPGTGVGLALVADFARLHEGRAWVADRPGGGASFHVYLPAAPARIPAAQP
jgi:PAS domain S-box-containing protein